MNKSRLICLLIVFSLAFAAARGAAWTTKRLTYNSSVSDCAAIAGYSANIYVVWSDNSQGNFDIYFKKSVDSGATWQTAQRLTYSTGSFRVPTIAISGANIYVVWCDDTPGNKDIYFKKSADGGATWHTAKKLTSNTGESRYPVIAVSGSNIYVVWHDDTPGNAEIYFRKSVDGGATWQTAKRLTNNAGSSVFPSIAASGSDIHVVWQDNTPGNAEIYYIKSADGGSTWKTLQRLTENAGDSLCPAIAFNGAKIFVVWENDISLNHEIFFRKSADNGATWQVSKRLTHASGFGGSGNSSIAVSGANIYIAWEDTTKGNNEIYFMNSADNGTTWLSSQRLTNNAGYSYNPAIIVNFFLIYVVWYDDTPGNLEIYLKYTPLL